MIGAAALVLHAGPAHADNLVGDGDGVTPVVGNSVGFGDVCTGASTVTKDVLLAIQRTSNSATNTFANGTNVALSVVSAPSGLTVGLPTTPRIALPGTWAGAAQNTMSAATVKASVQLSTAAPRAYGSSDVITFRATGTAVSGGTLSKETTVPVTGRVSSCDTTAPTLHLPGATTVEATGAAGAVVPYTASASDANPSSPAVACTPPSGSTFRLGTTTVQCSATDAAGNRATGSFTVTVEDRTGPEIGAIGDLTVEAESAGGAVITYAEPTATDAVTGSRPVTCDPAPGGTFRLGTTPVTCTAADGNGNTTTTTFGVTVEDTTAPVLSVPTTVTAEATSATGADVTYAVSAADLVDGDVTPACSPASGGTFRLGSTPVECSATDAAGNSASGSFTVTVQDTTAPVLGTVGDVTAEATSAAGAAVSFTEPTATDAVDGPVDVDCGASGPGDTFPLGTTTVTCSVSDSRGNSDDVSFDVTVQDTTAPALTVQDVKVAATGPGGALVDLTGRVAASDLVDGAVVPVCTPPSGVFPIGGTTVTCTATDSRGNTSGAAALTVVVQRTFTGFHQPVDTARTLNAVKSGTTVPLKFNVLAGSTQLSGTDLFRGLGVREIGCNATQPLDAVEELSSGSTSLRWDATAGQYVWNWKTPGGAAGRCYQVTVTTTDGASLNALFKLR